MTPLARDAFLPALRGIPGPIVAKVLNRHRTGCNWHGCSKGTMQELLFGTFDRVLPCLPSLAILRDECRALMAQRVTYQVVGAKKKSPRRISAGNHRETKPIEASEL